MSTRAHFAPRLADDVDEFFARVVGVLAGEVAQFGGDES